MPLAAKLAQLVDDLAPIEDPQERLAYVVDRAKRLPALPPADRTDANRVHGCVSVVWLVGEVRDGLCVFRCDADSPLVRGLVVLLCDFFSGLPPAAIATSAADPLDALGLTRNLSPTRRHGLAAALRTIQTFARSHAGGSAPPAQN